MDVVAPDPNQVDGYLVVLKPGIAFARWRAEAERGASPEDVAAYLSQPRTAIPAIDRSRYRGIRREAIDRWWEGEPPGNACRPDEKARRRIWELYGPDPCLHWTQPPWFDADLLTTLAIARDVLSLSNAPGDREILRVTRNDPAITPETVGFDVGYWGSDHFSILADALIMPRWHGCPPEQFGSLGRWARALNDHLLFRTAADAGDYRRWYIEQDWAEEEGEPGQFQVIRADLAA